MRKLLILILLVLLPQISIADDYPQRGLLAAAGNIGHQDLTIPETWNGPIAGSVGISGPGECKLGVTNNSSQTWQISVELIEVNDSGTRSAGSQSLRLRPGDNRERAFKTRNGVRGCALLITRHRVIG